MKLKIVKTLKDYLFFSQMHKFRFQYSEKTNLQVCVRDYLLPALKHAPEN